MMVAPAGLFDAGPAWWVPRYLRSLAVIAALSLLLDLICLGRFGGSSLTLPGIWLMARDLERGSQKGRRCSIAFGALVLATGLCFMLVGATIGTARMSLRVFGWEARPPSTTQVVIAAGVLVALALPPFLALLHPRAAAAFAHQAVNRRIAQPDPT